MQGKLLFAHRCKAFIELGLRFQQHKDWDLKSKITWLNLLHIGGHCFMQRYFHQVKRFELEQVFNFPGFGAVCSKKPWVLAVGHCWCSRTYWVSSTQCDSSRQALMFLEGDKQYRAQSSWGKGGSHDLAELSVFKQNYHPSNGKAGSLPVKTSATVRGSLRGRQSVDVRSKQADLQQRKTDVSYEEFFF